MITKVSVLGLGYIGLPTALVISGADIDVVGIDINDKVVDKINSGVAHISEPSIHERLNEALERGRFKAATSVEASDIFVIAVPTPILKSTKEPDLSHIKSAVEAIAPVLKPHNLIILESTIPVGTTEKFASALARLRPDLIIANPNCEHPDIHIAHCPERVLPGQIFDELINNDRIIGGVTHRCGEQAANFYKNFVLGECLVTSVRVAEMAKLAENSYRDVNIAYANELSLLCHEQDIDVWELISLANRHPRVDILQPGPGVGGHCIAVDPWFIVSNSPRTARLIKTARLVNDDKPNFVLEQIKKELKQYLIENPSRTADSITVACYGISFKPDIDDLRSSPALQIAEKISLHHSGTLLIVEPNISQLPENLSKTAKLVSREIAAKQAEIKILLVDHKEFRASFFADVRSTDKFIDTRGVLKSQRIISRP